ncbi:hypothetical protein [Cryptosporidium parvum Iowa II]|uniref:Transcription initiation factor TFIID subunit 8 n=2 Tax=Cryptosporidium parvum TaxID=5807 RepID=Q5CTV0_CRYPI|nr:hypothetical protein [Cryptosporidium parvum Iowa II]EAK88823.1 hypothetical protein cgd2_1470 [Cryptosporidium parvum Iowa II]QOY43086.1 Uncharacterized protein CPATCC_0029350 [Cryptosporidium parvum]WKS76442.1 hypothetical protein CPCDC_2g1470 [Cryptosporidium sp. 43IA8]WRK30936.1 Uncharacterized protein cpbgf_2001470 [Cryptosporidium parvum]|eukprot:QOY43086.1 hypothetical protein CPATCC_000793 [Cryptosporidium parvum]
MKKNPENIEYYTDHINKKITNSISNSIRLLLRKFDVELDDPNILDTATEAYINYIELLGKISSSIAIAAGRTQVNIVDIKKSIKSLDIKRYEQVFLDSELESTINKKNNFGTNFLKRTIPDICTNGNSLWRDVLNDTNNANKKSLDPELFEYVDSIPKHIPDFLPIFPPRLDYCDKFISSQCSNGKDF